MRLLNTSALLFHWNNKYTIRCYNILFFILIFLFTSFAQLGNQLDRLNLQFIPNTNQLQVVSETVNSSTWNSDIDDQTNNNGTIENYAYNAIGQLTKDESENILEIKWHINGKVKEVTKTTGEKLIFTYDAIGNKIQKQYVATDLNSTITYYLYDTKGKLFSKYEAHVDINGVVRSTLQTEIPLYGANKIGVSNNATEIITDNVEYKNTQTKQFELADHLGNIRAVVKDYSTPTYDARGKLSSLNVELSSTADYFAYGSEMPGRTYNSNEYAYGIQGKEKNNEWAGSGNSYDFGARILDPRLGRWLSTDPLADKYPSLSPYCSMGNSPITMIDPDGQSYATYRFNRAMEALIGSDPNHPLRFLLDQNGRLNVDPAKGGVNAGHTTSSHSLTQAHSDELAIEDAKTNQMDGSTIERAGVVKKSSVVLIGGLPVNEKTAEMWVQQGLISQETLDNAPRLSGGWTTKDINNAMKKLRSSSRVVIRSLAPGIALAFASAVFEAEVSTVNYLMSLPYDELNQEDRDFLKEYGLVHQVVTGEDGKLREEWVWNSLLKQGAHAVRVLTLFAATSDYIFAPSKEEQDIEKCREDGGYPTRDGECTY